jgi:hypothetical protein
MLGVFQMPFQELLKRVENIILEVKLSNKFKNGHKKFVEIILGCLNITKP